MQVTHDQVKRVSDQDVQKYTKRYEAYVSSKTTESMIDSTILLASKAVDLPTSRLFVRAEERQTSDGVARGRLVPPAWTRI